MAIRKPNVSVTEAKRLAKSRWDEPTSTPSASVPAEEDLGTPGMLGIGVQAAQPEPAQVPTVPARTVVKRIPADGVFPELEPAEPKVQVFLSAPLPATGVSPSFDALNRQYPAAKALQMILRRALDGYEIRLENGSHATAPANYPAGEPAGLITIVQTSRMIPVRVVDLARKHFDPLGFESTRAFGRKLACAALATFFAAERKHRQ